MTRLGKLGTGMAMILACGSALLPMGSATGAPPTSSLNVTTGGNPVTAAEVGDDLDLKAAAPINDTGVIEQRIETRWDPDGAELDPSSIVRPEGWDLEYKTGASTWSGSLPGDPSTVNGVRTKGDVDSGGFAGGHQISTASGEGVLETADSSFSGAAGGDGWDAFADETRVFNVFHHQGSRYNLDCHYKIDGSSCGALYYVDNYVTPLMSSGTIVNGKVYSLVEHGGDKGYICTNVSTSPFTSCGWLPLIAGGSGDWHGLGGQTSYGDRIYAAVSTGSVICYDVSDASACAATPRTLAGFSNVMTQSQVHAGVVGDRLYVMANKVWCFDAATMVACSGSWPVGNYSGKVHQPVPMRNSGGVITGACVLLPLECYELDGDPATTPAGLADAVADLPVEGYSQHDNAGVYGFTDTRQFWFTGAWVNNGTLGCYDWKAGAACDDFDTTTGRGIMRYAIRVDDTNPNCVWTNGDNGVISSFEPYTGQPGCASADPTVTVPYTTLAPRLSCAADGRVRGYRELVIAAPDGVSTSDIEVTILDSDGDPVSGFVGMHPGSGGVIDLTGLDVADTGTEPSVRITSPDTSTENAAAIEAELTYESDVPQLCLTLSVQHQCPTASEGIALADDVDVSALSLSGETLASAGGLGTPIPISASATRADMPDCLGSVEGTVERDLGGGASEAVSGITVRLYAPGDVLLTSTTTASDGTYSFGDRVIPGAYSVRTGGQTSAESVAALGTSDADFALVGPTAAPVTSTGVGTAPETGDIVVPSGGSVTLLDGDGDPATSVTVTGEGTYVLNSVTGVVTFTPVLGFSGLGAGVDYRVTDEFGLSSESTYKPTVTKPALAAAAKVSTGVGTAQQSRMLVIPAGGSVTLLDGDGDPATSVTVAGEGTYTLDADTGELTFEPLLGFSGATAGVEYRVADAYGQTDESTYTPTVTKPAAPAAEDLATEGAQGEGQSVQLDVPAGGSIRLLDAQGHPTKRVSFAGRGTYTLDDDGLLTFTPVAGFSGEAPAVEYQITDAYGQVTLGEYAATVEPAVEAQSGPSLPKTGAPLAMLGGFAAVLMLGGYGLLATSRRRKTQAS